MKMSERLEAAFNEQITAEIHSAHSYLQMGANAESQHLLGVAQWFRIQAQEERDHAMRFYEHLLGRGNEVRLGAIPAPAAGPMTPLHMFRSALEQERDVSAKIHALFKMATEESDFPSYSLLQWFINEQVEEESSVELIVAHLEMVGDDKTALLMMDNELGQRASGRATEA